MLLPSADPGARCTVALGWRPSGDPDLVITQRGNLITVGTRRFTTNVEMVTFRNERGYVN